MKKLLLSVASVFLFVAASAQQTVILQNSQPQIVQDNNVYSINGIPSSADIGGVEATVVTEMKSRYQGEETHVCRVRLVNHNPFKVTVLYQAGPEKVTGSVVIDPNDYEIRAFGYVQTGYGGAIPTSMFNVFTITRRLQ